MDYYVDVLKRNGLVFHDFRLLPSAAEVVHWFNIVQRNIEQNLPHDVSGPIRELYNLARNGAHVVAENKIGMYSIIAIRDIARDKSAL